jgi:hypothetical protein
LTKKSRFKAAKGRKAEAQSNTKYDTELAELKAMEVEKAETDLNVDAEDLALLVYDRYIGYILLLESIAVCARNAVQASFLFLNNN